LTPWLDFTPRDEMRRECYRHVSFNYTQLLPDRLRAIPEIHGIAVYSPPR
jgi:hypothetical protein